MSVNIISLNQIIALFKDFADRHYFINDFGYGATSDIGTSRQMEFPYMWVTTTQDSVINPQNRTAIPDLSFVVLFMDKTNNQENYLDINGVNSNNVQEILSDTLQTLQDFITEIQVSFGDYGLMLIDVVRCYPGIDETQDSVNGWIGEFTIRVKHSNCILPTGEIVQTNLTPINPTTRYLTCDTLSNCQVIQDIQNEIDSLTGTSYNVGLFSQTGDSVTISATTTETSLIGGGVGSLSVPPNGFNIGDSFRVKMGGVISNQNNHTLRLKLKSGSVILADSGVKTLQSHSNDIWDLGVDFTIRNIGSGGTGSIITLGTFQTTKKNSGNVQGFSFETLNNTTFDTTTSNTLDITIEWGQSSSNDIIYSRTFTLNKVY
jgi:hypothetical protein